MHPNISNAVAHPAHSPGCGASLRNIKVSYRTAVAIVTPLVYVSWCTTTKQSQPCLRARAAHQPLMLLQQTEHCEGGSNKVAKTHL